MDKSIIMNSKFELFRRKKNFMISGQEEFLEQDTESCIIKEQDRGFKYIKIQNLWMTNAP